MSFLNPPKLCSQNSLSGQIAFSCSAKNFTMPSPKVKSTPFQESKLTSTLTKLCSSSLSSGTWNVPLGSIKPKPDNYTLDQMSTIVMGSDAQSIATKISACLRQRSILAIYGETKAKAKCVSAEGVEFRIKLFAGKGRFSKGVIVEVQRRNNWSISYFQDCRAILESAECDHYVVEKPSRTRIYPSSFENEFKDDSKLHLVKLLLYSSNPSIESVMLVLESINSLTDTHKCGKVKALSTAKAIFIDEDDENKDVRDFLYNIAINQQISLKNLDHFQCADKTMKRYFELTLTSIARSILLLAEETLLCEVLHRSNWVENDLIEVFTKQIQNHRSHPQSSVLVSKCLISITESSSNATNTAINLGILNILQHQTNAR